MMISRNAWYAPKNTTHFVLCALLILVAVPALITLAFRQQIRSVVAELCTSFPNNPQQESTLTIFEENYSYQTLNSTADLLWKQVVTPNGGFIIDESRDDTGIYGIAMFHQLHCVQMFRMNFQELFMKLENGINIERDTMHHMDMEHTLHCLDYLRQVFLCYADGSIEPTVEDPEGGVPKTNGMVPHSCNNPSALYEQSLASHWSAEHMAGLKVHEKSDMHSHGH